MYISDRRDKIEKKSKKRKETAALDFTCRIHSLFPGYYIFPPQTSKIFTTNYVCPEARIHSVNCPRINHHIYYSIRALS